MTTRRASFQTFLWFDTLAVSGFMLLRSKCYSNVDSNGCNRARAARGCRCSRCSKPSRGSVKPVRVQDARCIRAKQEVDPEAPEKYSDEVIASPAQGKDKVYYGRRGGGTAYSMKAASSSRRNPRITRASPRDETYLRKRLQISRSMPVKRKIRPKRWIQSDHGMADSEYHFNAWRASRR